MTMPNGCAVIVATILAFLCVSSGDRANAVECPLPGQEQWMIVQLYFGQTVMGRPIPAKEWASFLADVVTPDFPDGLTAYDAYGQWRDPGTKAIEHQKSKMVQIATPDTPEARQHVKDVAEAFKNRFAQKSVGIVTMPGCAVF